MSIRVDSSSLISGAVVVGDPGLGVLAESVPSTGEHGAGYLYDSLEPADTGKEVRGLITTWPTLGTLTAFEDSSFEYDGASDTFAFQMYVDGAAVGTPQTVTVTVGAAAAGTLSAQESGADAAAIAGAVLVAGALSVTESGADTASALGNVLVSGSLSAAEQGADTAIIVGGNILAGYMAAQESGSDTAAASGAVVVSGTMSASEAGADGFAASGSIGSSDIIGNVAALESGADSIVVSGVVIVSGSMAAAEAGSDTMQTDNGEWYPSSRTISVPSGRTITLRPR